MKVSWKKATLESLSDVFTDGDWIESKDQSLKGIRLVQTGNVGFGVFKDRKDKARYISPETFERLKCEEIFPGDILVSRLPDPPGRACIIPEIAEKMITAVDCTIIRLDTKKMIPDFFRFYSQSRAYLEVIEEQCTGTTRKRISRKNLGKIYIPVPHLDEQKQIINTLNTIFSKIDRIEEIEKIKAGLRKNTNSDSVPLLNQLRQSILQKAFAGELVNASVAESKTEPLLSSANDNHTHHAGIIAYADSYFRNNAPDTFHGRTIFEKVAQAAEAIAGIELGRQAVQGMRGPTDDKQRDAVEVMASEKDYFSFESTGGKGMKLQRGRNFSELRLSFEQKFQAQIPALDKFLRLIAPMPTRDVEVLSTVHTAWNNYLIEKQAPTDKQIVHAAREGWHEEKIKIPRDKFFTAIETLRKRDLIPTGQGKYVGKIAGQSFDF